MEECKYCNDSIDYHEMMKNGRQLKSILLLEQKY